MEKIKAKVTTKKLAFWESLIDLEAEPARYLNENDTVTIISNVNVFGGIQGDKEYCKVSHSLYGVGYMRKEGLEVV